MPRFPAEEWLAEQLRFTLFPVPGETTRSADWWRFATGVEPEEITTNTRRGSGLVKGAYGPGLLQLRLEPDRIDWVQGPPEGDPTTPTADFNMEGVGFQLIDDFSALVYRWLGANDVPEITRVAFGAVLTHPIADRQAGYVQLADYVPVRIEPNSSDFVFQINPPPVASATGIENLRLNRLNKWMVAAHGVIMVSFDLAAGGARGHREAPQNFFIRLELDVNTLGIYEGAIPRDRLVEVCNELVDYAKRIATNGIV